MRRRLAVAPFLLIVLLLAGCVSQPVTPAAVKDLAALKAMPRPEVQVPKFLDPVLLGTITGGSEPNVGVAKDGTVYVSTPLAIWRSDDGRSYKQLGSPTCPAGLPTCGPLGGKNPGLVGGGDGAIAVADDGTVFWLGLGGGVPFQRSSDKAESWSKPFDVADKHSSDREWLAINRTGSVFTQWRDFGSSSSDKAMVKIRVSDDNGKSFKPTVAVVEDGHQGPIAPDPSSDWLFLPHVIGSTKLNVARSHDGGQTWEDMPAAPLIDDTFQFPVAAVDQAGTVYVVYANGNFDKTQNYLADRLPNVPRIMMISSGDHGVTWSAPVPVSAAGRPAVFPWIVAGAPGRVAVAYYQAAQPLPLVAPNAWTTNVAMSTTADAAEPKWAVGVASKGNNHVGQICVVGSGCGPQDRSLLDFFEIRMLPDGKPVLAYVADAEVKMRTVKVYATSLDTGTSLLEAP